MSFFYLIPVKGELPVHLLSIILEHRLTHLRTICKGDPVHYNEYVVEGSVYDNVGHFMLCIVTILSEKSELLHFFTKAECQLFKLRLVALTAYEMRSFSKRLLKNIRKYENVPICVYSLRLLCQHLMLKHIAQHICSSCDNSCTLYNIRLNFRQCLPLVARRLVELENGMAIIPCSRWQQLLLIIFNENMKNRLHKIHLDHFKQDPRIMELVNKIKNTLSMGKSITNVLQSTDVDIASINFPPCMLNLHLSLRKKHRLTHSQRFYYSLFLKDIGMPIEESISFWRSEYTLTPNGEHSCCHSWVKDEKKYLYGIRHMYGLEGCKKSYTSVNCQRIQSIDNACSEGGCPFKTFDKSKMIPLLKNCSNTLLSHIIELKNKHLYTSACLLSLRSNNLKLNDCDDISSFNFTPVKYYTSASKLRTPLEMEII